MSDITKKILSIEPEIDTEPSAPKSPSATKAASPATRLATKTTPIIASVTAPPTASSTEHASDIPSLRRDPSKPDSFPDFISRQDRQAAPKPADGVDSQLYNIAPPKTGWIMWTGIVLALIWIISTAAVYFGLFGVPAKLSPIALSGFILAVSLPAILITLLWTTWRRLAQLSHQAGRVAHAAQILTRADESALMNTRNLALGIQSELSMVDEALNKMLDRFAGLKTDITAHSQEINTVGLTLTERSDDVGRNLTLQRQALESITNTFDTRMETLSGTIETQSQKLSEVTDIAAKNIESAEQILTQAAETLSTSEKALLKTSQDTQDSIEKSAQTLTHNHDTLTQLHKKISDLINALTAQQDKVKSDLATQSEALQEMSNMAKGSTDTLQQNLNLGHDLLSALNSAHQGTQETVQQRFRDMEDMLGQTQNRADSLAEAANARIRDSLSQARKDLSKLEADMQVLSAQLKNAREQSVQLHLPDLDSQNVPQNGFGRLQLKPLETDFPPVEPPRFPRSNRQTQLFETPQLGDNFEDDLEASFGDPRDTSFDAPTVSATDGLIHLGADMEIMHPDDDILGFEPDIAQSNISKVKDTPIEPIGKGFGRTRNSKEKAKSGWRWRDMLGGLERPDSKDAMATTTTSPQPLSAPLSAPISFSDTPTPVLSNDIVNRLNAAKLSPAAIVDEGTIIEAAKARSAQGPAAMLKAVETRLSSPVEHLRGQFAQNIDFQNTAKTFVARQGQDIARISSPETGQEAALRSHLGTLEGRAYLLCAAALS